MGPSGVASSSSHEVSAKGKIRRHATANRDFNFFIGIYFVGESFGGKTRSDRLRHHYQHISPSLILFNKCQKKSANLARYATLAPFFVNTNLKFPDYAEGSVLSPSVCLNFLINTGYFFVAVRILNQSVLLI